MHTPILLILWIVSEASCRVIIREGQILGGNFNSLQKRGTTKDSPKSSVQGGQPAGKGNSGSKSSGSPKRSSSPPPRSNSSNSGSSLQREGSLSQEKSPRPGVSTQAQGTVSSPGARGQAYGAVQTQQILARLTDKATKGSPSRMVMPLIPDVSNQSKRSSEQSQATQPGSQTKRLKFTTSTSRPGSGLNPNSGGTVSQVPLQQGRSSSPQGQPPIVRQSSLGSLSPILSEFADSPRTSLRSSSPRVATLSSSQVSRPAAPSSPVRQPSGTAPIRFNTPDQGGKGPFALPSPVREPSGTAPIRFDSPVRQPSGIAPIRFNSPAREPSGTAPIRFNSPVRHPSGTAPIRFDAQDRGAKGSSSTSRVPGEAGLGLVSGQSQPGALHIPYGPASQSASGSRGQVNEPLPPAMSKVNFLQAKAWVQQGPKVVKQKVVEMTKAQRGSTGELRDLEGEQMDRQRQQGQARRGSTGELRDLEREAMDRQQKSQEGGARLGDAGGLRDLEFDAIARQQRPAAAEQSRTGSTATRSVGTQTTGGLRDFGAGAIAGHQRQAPATPSQNQASGDQQRQRQQQQPQVPGLPDKEAGARQPTRSKSVPP